MQSRASVLAGVGRTREWRHEDGVLRSLAMAAFMGGRLLDMWCGLEGTDMQSEHALRYCRTAHMTQHFMHTTELLSGDPILHSLVQ